MLTRASSNRPVVLALLGAFWPGHEAAGPNQSFRELATALSGEFAFKVVARDRAFGAGEPLAASGTWVDLGFAQACYCPGLPLRGAGTLGALLRTTPHDVLMLTAFFDREFTIPALILRRLGLIPRRPTILSPRGEFSTGALGLKRRRKRAYLTFARRFGLMDGVIMHASGPQEVEDIRRECPWADRVIVAADARSLGALPPYMPSADGRLRVVFSSRIDRMKNLDFAFNVLASVRVAVRFDIIGPITHEDHWRTCRCLIERLPRHVTVRYLGAIPNSEVRSALAGYDLFFLPTRGENFGHAILDALEAGTPVLISDRTPWRNLEHHHAGWSLPLSETPRFTEIIERFAAMNEACRLQFRHGARHLAERRVAENDAVARNREMLLAVLATDGSAVAWSPSRLIRTA